MSEDENQRPRRGWFGGFISKVVMWFKFIGSGSDLPDPDSSDYVDLGDVDVFNTEVMVIGSRSFATIQYVRAVKW